MVLLEMMSRCLGKRQVRQIQCTLQPGGGGWGAHLPYCNRPLWHHWSQQIQHPQAGLQQDPPMPPPPPLPPPRHHSLLLLPAPPLLLGSTDPRGPLWQPAAAVEEIVGQGGKWERRRSRASRRREGGRDNPIIIGKK